MDRSSPTISARRLSNSVEGFSVFSGRLSSETTLTCRTWVPFSFLSRCGRVTSSLRGERTGAEAEWRGDGGRALPVLEVEALISVGGIDNLVDDSCLLTSGAKEDGLLGTERGDASEAADVFDVEGDVGVFAICELECDDFRFLGAA